MIGVITVVNDVSGKIDEKKSCGACVHFERHVRFKLEEGGRKAGIDVIVLNQQEFGKQNIDNRVPDVIKESAAWYPKFFWMEDSAWEKVQKNKAEVVDFDVYNGELIDGKWKLKSRPMQADQILAWATSHGGKSARTRPRADPLDGIILVGRRWRHQYSKLK